MKRLVFLILLTFLFLGCSQRKCLVDARQTLERARGSEEVKKYAKIKLGEAEEAYARAEKTHHPDDCYVAKRKAEIVLAYADAEVAEKGYEKVKEEYKEVQDKEKEDEIARLKQELAEKERLLKEKEEYEKAQDELIAALKGLAEVKRDERGLVIYISDILFDFDKKDLKPGGISALTKIAQVLKKYLRYKFSVEGHTDSIGTEEYNMKLSIARAETVSSFLIGQSIDSNRIATRGYGESRPMATNKAPEGRQRNRRVEIIVTQ